MICIFALVFLAFVLNFCRLMATAIDRQMPEMEPKALICRCFHEQHSVSSMSTVAKLSSVAFLGAAVLGSWLAPAYALRMPISDGLQAARQQAVSSYAGDNQASGAAEASILTPSEIRHIKWCAARYTLNYDAVNDTYAGADGNRLRCQSPR